MSWGEKKPWVESRMAKVYFSCDLHDTVRHVLGIQVDKRDFHGNRARYMALYDALREISNEELDTLMEEWSKKVKGRTTIFADPRDAKILIGLLMKTEIYLNYFGENLCNGLGGPGVYNKKNRKFESCEFVGHFEALVKLLQESEPELKDEVEKLLAMEVKQSDLLDRYIQENIVMVLPFRREALDYIRGMG